MMSERYSASDAITAEKLTDMRNVDERTDDYATLTNDELADKVDQLKMIFDGKHANYLMLRLAAARLRGEQQAKLRRG